VFDRYLVRLEECHQSNRILQQALDRLPDGPINVDDPRVILPSKTRAMSDMEAMIFHFKQVMEGVKAPVGRGVRRRREPQGRARHLPRVRRDGKAGALAHPAALLHHLSALPGWPKAICCPT